MISEVRYVTVAVRDLDRARRFYQETFDYVTHDTATVAGPAFAQLWRLPAGVTAEVAVVGPAGADSGRLRLVAFDHPGEPYWGDYADSQDYGHYALNIRVPEIHSAVQRLRDAGGRSKSEPTRWTVTPQVSAWDSLSYDPDGVILDVFELEPAPGSLMDDYDGRCTALQTICRALLRRPPHRPLLRRAGLPPLVRQDDRADGGVLPDPRRYRRCTTSTW